MKQMIPLTKEQQKLVETHLYIVGWVITESIYVNETIFGFEYEDLYQEGCFLLCHAARTYNPDRAMFSTYSKKVVYNGLLTYCRKMCQHPCSHLSIGTDGEMIVNGSFSVKADNNSFEAQVSIIETLDLLASAEKTYKGVARLGIRAMKLRLRGLSIKEIAELYHVPTTYIGAWISRASQKLRKDPSFLSELL